MNWHNIFSMGNYGAYVWTTYAITLIVFGINICVSLKEKSRAKNTVRRYLMGANES